MRMNKEEAMKIFKNNPELENFNITTTKDLIDGYEFSELKEENHKLVLQGMQFMYDAAINAAENSTDYVRLSLCNNKSFANIATDVIDDFVPEFLHYLVLEMAETLISFLDNEACEE